MNQPGRRLNDKIDLKMRKTVMQKILSVILVLMLAVTVTACGKKKVVEMSPGDSGGITNEDTSGINDGTEVIGLTGGTSIDGGPLGDPNNPNDPLGKRVVYFEYDSSTLTAEGQSVVEAHSNWLANNLASIVLEGHADERGTREYNLALGEDRAKTVARLMQALGVSESSQQVISYGEERPVALGTEEASWGLNRRVELLYGQ